MINFKGFQTIKINIINNKKMNNQNPKNENFHYFPFQQLHKIVHHDKLTVKRLTSKKLIGPKAAVKNHAKSLVYYQSLNSNQKPASISILNSTGVNLVSPNMVQQTLNEELLRPERPKPRTSDIKSGRLAYIESRNADQLKINKISLRSSSNYKRLSSVAGVPLNETEAQYRMESYLVTKNNTRKIKYKQIEKENKKIAERLSSQQSQYSTKKLLKQYESAEKISKRLTDSKVSRRSNQFADNRSVCSQNSSRQSVRSGSSRNSQTSSMKSTSRLNSSNSSARKNNRFQSKFQQVKKIKIIEHNINKIGKDDLNKFKNLFANSFTTKNVTKIESHNLSYHKRLLNNNPYVDIQIISQKSQTSIKNQRAPAKQSSMHSINASNRKLKELNVDISLNSSKAKQNNNDKIAKKSSVITSDGLLHRIVEEMYYDKKGSTDNLIYRGPKKRVLNSTAKTTNLEIRNQVTNRAISKNSKRKPVQQDTKRSVLDPLFSGKF